MEPTERQLIEKAAAADRVAFRQLVMEHSHAMFRLAWRLSADEHAAEDIVQEAFIKTDGSMNYDKAYPWLISSFIPSGLKGLVLKSKRIRPRISRRANGHRSWAIYGL